MNFQVELTSHCDLTCGYCPNRDMQRRRTFMSDSVWEAILNYYIVPYRDFNAFTPPTFIGHKDGEPLLNKKFTDRLMDLSRVAPDMNIDIYSHGLMLPKLAAQKKDLFKFLGMLPNRVRYMMSYHPRNHDNSSNDYSEVIPYLKSVLAYHRPLNVEFITVSHKSPWVTEEMQDDWEQTWRGYPVTVHKNCSINPWTGRMEDIATCHYNGCPYADFGHWFFGVTGNVIACCLDLEEEIVLGNVLRQSAKELFVRTSEFYSKQRQILEDRSPVDHLVCANCFGQDHRHEKSDLIQLGVRGS